MTGVHAGSKMRAVVRFDGQHWRVLRSGMNDSLRGWTGSGNSIWIQSGNSLSLRMGEREIPTERKGALSGSIYDVLRLGENEFLVATGHGIARQALPLWSAPADSPGEIAHAIVEDREGSSCFARYVSLVDLA